MLSELKRQMRVSDELWPANGRQRAPLISRSVDQLLAEVVDRLVDDYFRSWYAPLVFDAEPVTRRVADQVWEALRRIKKRLSTFDQVNFFANNVLSTLTRHFQTDRRTAGVGHQPTVGAWSDAVERDFLCSVSDVLLSIALPPQQYGCQPLRDALREIVACKVLLPAVQLVCDPDAINCALHDYLQGVQMWRQLHEKTYSYAASYEDFVRVIRQSSDLDELKHIRYSIVSEIMQASMINNLKRARGIKLTRDSRPQSTSKGDLLQARNLKRYINQLSYAKTQCEKRIKSLGGTDYLSELAPSHSGDAQLVGRKFLSFGVIMESAYTRRYFRRYLDTEEGQGRLLDFWTRVNELRGCPRHMLHAFGGDIYQSFLAGARGVLKLDRVSLKRIENFLIGDRGPDVFYELQDEVQLLLENNHYHRFLVSPLYNKMMVDAEESGIDFINATVAGRDGDRATDGGVQLESTNVSDHSSFAVLKLDQLNERINTKVQALEGVRASPTPDPKMVALIQQEVNSLLEERCEWEAHIERTDLWTEHLGCWCVEVHSAELLEDKDMPVFVLVVYLVSSSPCPDDQVERAEEASSAGDRRSYCSILDHHRGWVVIRRLCDVRQLHSKLCDISPGLKTVDLPVVPGKRLFGKNCDQPYLDRAKVKVQKYLDLVLDDDRLNKSEVIYTFLSPSSQRLLFPGSPAKKMNTFFTVLKSVTRSSDDDSGDVDSDDEDLLFLDEANARRPHLRDDFAEPLYDLIAEVFDLSDKWLRKSLIVFVQLAYNQTISLHVRDIITWCFCEGQLQVYLTTLKNTCWPEEDASGEDGRTSQQPRTASQKEATREETRQLLLGNLPENMVILLGAHSARLGAVKVFDKLQDATLNKRLVYAWMEEFLQELMPELAGSQRKFSSDNASC